MQTRLYKFFLIIFTILWTTTLYPNPLLKKKKLYGFEKLNQYNFSKSFYIGYSLVSSSLQNNFSTSNKALNLGIELFKKNYAWSFKLDADLFSQYQFDIFTLNPYYLNANINYYILKQIGYRKSYDFYPQAGIGSCYAIFTENKNKSVYSYKYKKEKQWVPQFNLGLGCFINLNKIKLNITYTYNYGIAKFYAGKFNKQKINIGKNECKLSIAYCIKRKPKLTDFTLY